MTSTGTEPDDVVWPPPEAGRGWYQSAVSGRLRYFDGEEWLFWTSAQDLKRFSSDWELHVAYMHHIEDAEASGRLVPDLWRREFERLTEICEADAALGWYPPSSSPRPKREQREAQIASSRAAAAAAERAAWEREYQARLDEAARRAREEQVADQRRARAMADAAARRQEEFQRQQATKRGWIVAAVVVSALILIFAGGRAAGVGSTARCQDGTFSYSQHRSGTCSWHGGVAAWTGDGARSEDYKQGEQDYLDEQNANGFNQR